MKSGYVCMHVCDVYRSNYSKLVSIVVEEVNGIFADILARCVRDSYVHFLIENGNHMPITLTEL